MNSLFGAGFSVAAGLLMASGAAKLVHPDGVLTAMSSLGARIPRSAGRALGAIELTVGVLAFTTDGVLAPLGVGAFYLGFALIVMGLLRRGDAASCGCFGQVESPPSRLHLVLNLAAASTAFGHAAVGGWPSVVTFASDTAGGVGLYLVFVSLGVVCSVAILTVLPDVIAKTKEAATIADERHARIHGSHQDGSAQPIQLAARS